MFGKNEIVGQKFFSNQDKLLVTSAFITLQGEGPFSGLPAVFVRLAKCNLACSFCDTYFDKGNWFTVAELTEHVTSLLEQSDLHSSKFVLVITGGEPMLQGPVLVKWIKQLPMNFFAIQIESNGTIICGDLPHNVTLVVSPKCAEKDGVPIKYLAPKRKMLERANCLKFVMEADESSPYHEIPGWARAWHGDKYVSPINTYAYTPAKTESHSIGIRSRVDERVSFWEGLLDNEKNRANHEYTAQYAIKYGLRFQVQVHLYAGVA